MKHILTAIFLAVGLTATAQDRTEFRTFRNLGIGVEAGLQGFGVQLSTPLYKDRIILDAGFNFYGIKPKFKIPIDKEGPNEGLEELNQKLEDDVRDHPERAGAYRTFDYLEDDFDVNSRIRLTNNVKVMFELFPAKKSSFHFSLGLMMSNGKFINVRGQADETVQKIFADGKYDQDVWNNFKKQEDPSHVYEDFIFNNARYNIDDRTFGVDENVRAEVSIMVAKVKPYFGIGFGRPIPHKRVGFQFELGAWYHGTPTFSSPNEREYDPFADGIDGVADIMSRVKFYPQMTFRLTGRIL